MTRLSWAALVVVGASFVQPSVAQVHVEVVAEGLEHPWSLAFLDDGRLLVTERPGRLRILAADGTLSAPVSGVPSVHAAGQAGLKDIALAPDFDVSGRLYLSYACGTATANTTCLAGARLEGHALHDVRTLFRAQPLRRGNAHYGGRIAVLPDGTLLLTLGDAFDLREQAQDPASHLGKVVRLNADGTVPVDNPFVGDASHAAEIFTLGHRNVQGVVWDDTNQRIIAHEHGPRGGDEINILVAGANYGWPFVTTGIDYSGALVSPFRALPGFQVPLLTFTPSIAPSDMTLYNGDLFPDWRGDLLISALAHDRGIHRLRLDGDQATVQEILLADRNERIRSVRTGPDGAVYALTDSPRGVVLRITPFP